MGRFRPSSTASRPSAAPTSTAAPSSTRPRCTARGSRGSATTSASWARPCMTCATTWCWPPSSSWVAATLAAARSTTSCGRTWKRRCGACRPTTWSSITCTVWAARPSSAWPRRWASSWRRAISTAGASRRWTWTSSTVPSRCIPSRQSRTSTPWWSATWRRRYCRTARRTALASCRSRPSRAAFCLQGAGYPSCSAASARCAMMGRCCGQAASH